MLEGPICIYDNWSAYDELSDIIELTEELALRELDELLRLMRSGVKLDYYLMDAFGYDPDGGYRTWRKPRWPDGPDRWLNRCLEHEVKPVLNAFRAAHPEVVIPSSLRPLPTFGRRRYLRRCNRWPGRHPSPRRRAGRPSSPHHHRVRPQYLVGAVVGGGRDPNGCLRSRPAGHGPLRVG